MFSKLFQSKNLRKKIAILLCICIVFNSIFLPVAVSADEGSQTENTEQQPSSTPEANTTSEIQTGDAGSQASSTSDVNHTETTTDGNISANGCNVEADLGCNPSTTNVSETSGETSSSSTSGGNGITDAEGNAEIQTGESTSQTTAENLLNTNVVDATGEAEIDEQNPDEVLVEMDNSAEHQATASAESVSGQNNIEGSGGNAGIQTGTSIAQTDMVNIINSNILGSNFEFFLLPIITDQNGDIDLNELWKQLQQKIAEQSANLSGLSNVYIMNTNEAYVDVSANSSAISGQNSATDNEGNASIQTGDSIASANIFNLINLNIIGSRFLFGIINIFGSLTGNIIVPNPQRFLEYATLYSSSGQSDIINQNFAYVSSNVQASADSGTNEQLDENGQSLKTGVSEAYASSTNFANLNLMLSSWYLLLLNNFGYWDGTVDSWENPSSSIVQDGESATYEIDNQEALIGENSLVGNTSVENINLVGVKADVSATAISGQNKTAGNKNSSIQTGMSLAFANLFNFLNTNIVGSNFFMPIINLFGSWKGNLVFAYPNLQVEMSADKQNVSYGDTLTYNVNYTNVGYEDARNVTLNIDLPSEAALISVSGPNYSGSGNQLHFFVGDVKAKSGGSFSFSARIEPAASAKVSPNLLEKILSRIAPAVQAAENGRELVTTANIATPDPETDTSTNNSSVVTFLVTTETKNESLQSSSQEGPDPGFTPQLEVSSANNTGDFVYPGDLVTFFTTVKNKGLGKALNTYVYQDIVFAGDIVVQNKFDLGDIDGGKQKKITFSVKIPKKATGGIYQSIIFSDAESTTGKLFYSNESVSEFKVGVGVGVAEGRQQIKEEGTVLAADAGILDDFKSQGNNLLYFILFIISILWYVEYIRRKDAEEHLELLLEKPENKVEKFFKIRNNVWFRKVLFCLRL